MVGGALGAYVLTSAPGIRDPAHRERLSRLMGGPVRVMGEGQPSYAALVLPHPHEDLHLSAITLSRRRSK